MTETCAQVCTQFPGEYGLANDAGPPLPFAIVHDVDGQLTVDGPVVQSPLKTQDLGRLLEGRVQISGRADSIINSGGKKIMPAEIEAVLDRHPQIHEAVVMGIDDTHWGQRVVACYVADTEGEAPSNGELDRWCRQSLSDYKIPKVWRQCAELPRNQMGKIDRVKLGSLFRDAQSGSPKAVHKGLGSGRRPEIGKMDEGVLLTDHTAVGPVIEASDDTAEGDGALRQSVDDHLGNQSVSTPHGPMKGSVSMDQGQADANLVEDSIEITESGGHHLLETDMRVLESSSIEHDAGTVDFVETGSDLKLERHNHPLNGRRTQGR